MFLNSIYIIYGWGKGRKSTLNLDVANIEIYCLKYIEGEVVKWPVTTLYAYNSVKTEVWPSKIVQVIPAIKGSPKKNSYLFIGPSGVCFT